MNTSTPLGKIMTRTVVVASTKNKLSEVLQFFRTYRVQHLPVTEGSFLMGILSINDILDFMAEKMLDNKFSNLYDLDEKFKITDVMTSAPNCLFEHSTVGDALSLFQKHKYQSVPIIENGHLVGIVTTKDIIQNM